MSGRFHIGKDGNPHRCTARPGECPLGGEHYSSIEECEDAIERIHAISNDDNDNAISKTATIIDPESYYYEIDALLNDKEAIAAGNSFACRIKFDDYNILQPGQHDSSASIDGNEAYIIHGSYAIAEGIINENDTLSDKKYDRSMVGLAKKYNIDFNAIRRSNGYAPYNIVVTGKHDDIMKFYDEQYANQYASIQQMSDQKGIKQALNLTKYSTGILKMKEDADRQRLENAKSQSCVIARHLAEGRSGALAIIADNVDNKTGNYLTNVYNGDTDKIYESMIRSSQPAIESRFNNVNPELKESTKTIIRTGDFRTTKADSVAIKAMMVDLDNNHYDPTEDFERFSDPSFKTELLEKAEILGIKSRSMKSLERVLRMSRSNEESDRMLANPEIREMVIKNKIPGWWHCDYSDSTFLMDRYALDTNGLNGIAKKWYENYKNNHNVGRFNLGMRFSECI